MKTFALTMAGVLAAGIAVGQFESPTIVNQHFTKLREAGSMTAKFTVQQLPGAPKEYKLTYSKPNFLKCETPTGFWIADGKSIYKYDQESNTYTVEDETDASLKAAATQDFLWAWAPFFVKDFGKETKFAKMGANRTIKTVAVTEASFNLPEEVTETLYLDPKLGVARGANYKGKREIIVFAPEIEVLKDPQSADMFVFAAPSGAKKAEAPKADEATYAMVQAIFNKSCMPCHSSSNAKGGLDLSTYSGMMAGGRDIVPGDPDSSRVVTTTKGPNPTMPKSRSPLTGAEVKTISDWIKAGAKQK